MVMEKSVKMENRAWVKGHQGNFGYEIADGYGRKCEVNNLGGIYKIVLEELRD